MVGSAQPAGTQSDPTLAGRTVLVIEDHQDSLELLTVVLQSLRARVLTARTVEDAERRLSTQRPDLIVCDMRLPDGTGLDFVQWLRGQDPRLSRIPCIAITGWGDLFPPERARDFDAYLRKPIHLDRFCNVAVTLARR